MGIIEKDSKQKRRKKDIQNAILNAVEAVGMLSASLVAPGAIKFLKQIGYKPGTRQSETIKRSRDRLVKRGFLFYDGKFLKLSTKGELEFIRIKDEKKQKPKKWDSRWRVLIFDIPEKRKGLREKVRNTLLDVGFVRLQDSVWLYPYDCEDFINLLKADFKVGKDLLYLVVESIENDKQFRKQFDLPL